MCATSSFVCNANTCRLDWEREIWHRAGHSILDDAACRISYRQGDIRAARFNLAPSGFLSFNNPPSFCQQLPSNCPAIAYGMDACCETCHSDCNIAVHDCYAL